MVISSTLRFYTATFMKNLHFTHRGLDELALTFLMDKGQGSVTDRCSYYASILKDEEFHKIAEYLLNLSMYQALMYGDQWSEVRKSYVRALQVNGFEIETDSRRFEVKPKFQPERTQQTKEKVATLLTNLGLDPVQGSLDIAEDLYVKGEYAKSLWNGRKALEDLMRLLAERKGIKQKELLTVLVRSKSARELIEKIDDYACKGHETQIPEYEAIFGYGLIIVAIYHLLLLMGSP